MNFDIPTHISDYLKELDTFIETTVKPLEQKDDNIRFFDHRREHARTDWDKGGTPMAAWEELLAETRALADQAGHFRFAMPKQFGGQDGSNLAMAIIRDHLAAKGLGLHNDLQNEHSIVGNSVGALLILEYGNEAQKAEFLEDLIKGDAKKAFAFGITEPEHGSDATYMETNAVKQGNDWIINGTKTWNTGIHIAAYDLIKCYINHRLRRWSC